MSCEATSDAARRRARPGRRPSVPTTRRRTCDDEELAQQLRRPLVARPPSAPAPAPAGRGRAVPHVQQHADDVGAELRPRPPASTSGSSSAGSTGACDRRPGTACPCCRSSGAPAPGRRPAAVAMPRIVAPSKPALGERRRARRRGPPPGCRGCRGAGPDRRAGPAAAAQLVLLRRVAAARARASSAAPATIATSSHIVPVAVAERPTSCSASTA